MKRTVVFLSMLVLCASALVAQAKPNFSGHWTMIADSTRASSGMAGMATTEVTIAQDDKTLTVTRMTQMGEMKLVYNLDGSDSKNTVQMGPNAVDLVSQAKWDGDKLTINTTISMGGNSIATSALYSLVNGNLVVQQTGPSMGGSPAPVITTTFKKS